MHFGTAQPGCSATPRRQRDVGMIGAKRSLSNRQRPLVKRLGAGVATLVSVQRRRGGPGCRGSDAEPLLKRSLAIYEKALGPDHPYVAGSLNNLAGLYQNQGFAPTRSGRWPAARRWPLPDAEIVYGEVSWRAFWRHQSYPNPRASERSHDFRLDPKQNPWRASASGRRVVKRLGYPLTDPAIWPRDLLRT